MFVTKIRIDRHDAFVTKLMRLHDWIDRHKLGPVKIEHHLSLDYGITILICLNARSEAAALATAFEGTWMGPAEAPCLGG